MLLLHNIGANEKRFLQSTLIIIVGKDDYNIKPNYTYNFIFCKIILNRGCFLDPNRTTDGL